MNREKLLYLQTYIINQSREARDDSELTALKSDIFIKIFGKIDMKELDLYFDYLEAEGFIKIVYGYNPNSKQPGNIKYISKDAAEKLGIAAMRWFVPTREAGFCMTFKAGEY